jgi:hypothetical protein
MENDWKGDGVEEFLTLTQCEGLYSCLKNYENDRRNRWMKDKFIALKHHVDDYECKGTEKISAFFFL